MHGHAIDRFARQCGIRLVIDLPGCDDVHFVSCRGQVKRQIGQNLAGGRMIGKELAVNEDQSRHRDWQRPVASACFRVT
jgi:hypothetical protein